MGSQRVGHDWATELNWTELSVSKIKFEILTVSVSMVSNILLVNREMNAKLVICNCPDIKETEEV